MALNSGRFHFDGGAASYFGTAILATLITVCTLGIGYPFGVVLMQRWRAKHSYIDGQRLVFTGTAMGLFGTWVKWLLLTVITLGIYLFWVGPRMQRWKWEHTDFDPTWVPNTLPRKNPPVAVLAGSTGSQVSAPVAAEAAPLALAAERE